MIAKNDRLRLSADEWPFSHSLTRRYLNRFTGDGQLFPPLFRDLLFPLFRECMQPENIYNYGLDQLIADNGYDQILVLYSFDSFKSDPYLYRAGVAG